METAVSQDQPQVFTGLLLTLLRRLTAEVSDPAVELPLAQLRVCGILREGPRAMSALSRELGVSVSSMTQIANRLERARLVKRVPRGDDRRIRCLQLTARGEKMMRRHEEARIARMAEVLKHLTPEEQQEAARALRTLIRAASVPDDENGNRGLQGHHFASSRILL